MGIESGFSLEPATWDVDQAALRAVRTRVFIQEQAVSEEEEWDALDAGSYHVLARDQGRHPIGTGRLTPERMIGRMAVLPDWRGRGVGEAMLVYLCERAVALGWREVTLNAQLQAIPFYERAGFQAEGPEFLDAGIRHRLMRKSLSAPQAPNRSGPRPIEGAETLDADSLAGVRDGIGRVLADGRHRLWIYTRDLDRMLYDREAVLGEIKRIAMSGRGAEIRILVQSPKEATREPHRLLGLAQRLSSYIHLRVPVADEDRQYPSDFVLNDVGGYLFRSVAGQADAQGSTRAPGRNRQLRDFFESVWQRSEPDPEFRSLSI